MNKRSRSERRFATSWEHGSASDVTVRIVARVASNRYAHIGSGDRPLADLRLSLPPRRLSSLRDSNAAARGPQHFSAYPRWMAALCRIRGTDEMDPLTRTPRRIVSMSFAETAASTIPPTGRCVDRPLEVAQQRSAPETEGRQRAATVSLFVGCSRASGRRDREEIGMGEHRNGRAAALRSRLSSESSKRIARLSKCRARPAKRRPSRSTSSEPDDMSRA